ncbi:MAG: hypothetical protein ACXWRU_17040 [Pseudobdellovibrionaceae bacterium]
MKKVLLTAAMLAMGSVSQAKVLCGVNGENPKQAQTYDRNLYFSEIAERKMVLISPDLSSAQEIKGEEFKSINWQAMKGQLVAFFSVETTGNVTLAVSKVDVTKSNNILPLQVMSVGEIPSQEHPQVLIYNHLSLTCSSF